MPIFTKISIDRTRPTLYGLYFFKYAECLAIGFKKNIHDIRAFIFVFKFCYMYSNFKFSERLNLRSFY